MQKTEKSNATQSTNVHFSVAFCIDFDNAVELCVQLRSRSSSSHESTGGSWSMLACVAFKSKGTAGPGARLRCAARPFFIFFGILFEIFRKLRRTVWVHTDWCNHGQRTRAGWVMGLKFHGKLQTSRCWFILTTAAVLPCERNHVVIVANMRLKHTLTHTAVFY